MKVCLNCRYQFASTAWRCPECGHEPGRLNGFVAHSADLAFGGGGFKAEYFGALASSEAASFWFRARNELILWALQTYQRDAKSFLEVGCGTGFVLSALAQMHPEIALSGSEIFVDGLSFAAARLPHADLMQMDARLIPFADEFDAVGAFDVLEHIEEDETVLEQLHKALKPGGLLLLTVPQHPWLWSEADDYACHVRRYTADELATKLARQNFVVERSLSFVSLLIPAMLVSRRRKKDPAAEYDALAELRLPHLLNETFYSIMKVEQKLIRWGVNFPFGGSRMVIARKPR